MRRRINAAVSRIWLGTAMALAITVAYGQTGKAYADLHDFGGPLANHSGSNDIDGFESSSSVTFDKAGNMYGTTESGGGNGGGMIWELTVAGAYVDLHDFGGTVSRADGTTGPDGTLPISGVTFDASGNMVGVTYFGGSGQVGTVWKLTPAGSYVDLHDFSKGSTDGNLPVDGVTVDSSGNIYGTASEGGPNLFGIVWEITSGGTYEILHAFGGTASYIDGTTGPDGSNPYGAVTFDASGNLYGTATGGGKYSREILAGGNVWELTASGDYVVLHSFGGPLSGNSGNAYSDGYGPEPGISFDRLGNMFGTTYYGGLYGFGVVWEYTAAGTYEDIHDFGGTISNANGTSGPDGVQPFRAAVAFDSAGNMYGTATAGGPNTNPDTGDGAGMVWEITPAKVYLDVHDFGGTLTNATGVTGPDGAGPWGGVAFDAAGNMYGTTYGGGPIAVSSSVHGGILWVLTSGKPTFEVSPTSLIGGATATGTVILGSPAPVGGTLVPLASTGAGVTTPASVTVAAGDLSATFTIGSQPVVTKSSAVITATIGGVAKSVTVTINPPSLSAITLSPSSVFGGTASIGMVTLTGIAPAGGIAVALSSNSAFAVPPAGVTVPAGATSASFSITTTAVVSTSVATIGASIPGLTRTAKLTVKVPVISMFTFNPTLVIGGATSIGTLAISGPAPSSGLAISLASGLASASVPSQVTIPAGTTSTTFTIATSAVSTTSAVTLSATLNGATVTAKLTVKAPVITALTLNPTTVVGGAASTGTITLGSPAPSPGLPVALASGSTFATVPSQVTVPAGATSATFTITTSAIATTSAATLSATLNGVTVTAKLTVKAPLITVLTLNPTSVVGGAASTGTITLGSPAPSSGLSISLASGSAFATVPSQVTVPAGTTSTTFTIATSAVGTTGTSTLSATSNGATVTAKLTVKAPVITAFTLNPTSVVGGASSTGAITIGSPAPSSGLSISLVSGSSSATVPSQVTIPAGTTSATFTIVTSPVATTTAAALSATLNGAVVTAKLNVKAPLISMLKLNPGSVVGGASSTGTITLSSPAPAAGLTIALSSNSTFAVVPASVTVAGGATSAAFTVNTSVVTANTTATITASLNGANTYAALVVKPK